MIKHNNKGFTLIEIIISIAVLSIISAIFLELFIKSDAVQKQGKITDDKTFLISNLFETLIAEDTIDGFAEHSQPAAQVQENKQVNFDFFYDEHLKTVAKDESNYYIQLIFKEKEGLKKGKLYLVTALAFADQEEVPLQMTTYFYEKKGE